MGRPPCTDPQDGGKRLVILWFLRRQKEKLHLRYQVKERDKNTNQKATTWGIKVLQGNYLLAIKRDTC